MFLHQVKMNIKKNRTTIESSGIVVLLMVYLRVAFGWGPWNLFGLVKLALIATGGFVLWAFVRTLWELAGVYYKKLRTFIVALHKFCRDYWSNQATAV
jgi:hypothetical protein